MITSAWILVEMSPDTPTAAPDESRLLSPVPPAFDETLNGSRSSGPVVLLHGVAVGAAELLMKLCAALFASGTPEPNSTASGLKAPEGRSCGPTVLPAGS